MCLEIDEFIFAAVEVAVLGFIILGKTYSMDLEKAQYTVEWPRPT